MNNDIELNNNCQKPNDGITTVVFKYFYESLKKCLYYPYNKLEDEQKENVPDFYKSRKDNKYAGFSKN